MASSADPTTVDQQSDGDGALPTPVSQETSSPPACVVCGRQDETLRLVSYPYAFSLILVTFRRAFSGLWCRKHRDLRLFLASLITAMFGWLGIPFGLFWTPKALFKLAQGGMQPRDPNRKLLTALAAQKQEAGDNLGALRCLEASLRFGDDAETTERVRELRAKLGVPAPRSALKRFVLSLPPALLKAFLLGTAAFAVDRLISPPISAFLTQLSNSLYVAIFTWLPGIAISFATGLILSRVVERTVVGLRGRRPFVSGAVAVVIAVFTMSGVLTGDSLGRNLTYLVFSNNHPGSVLETVYLVSRLSLAGAGWTMIDVAQPASTSETIFTVFIGVSFAYYLAVAVAAAVRSARWQRRLPRAVPREVVEGPKQRMVAHSKLRRYLLGCGSAVLLLCLALTCVVSAINQWAMVASRADLDINVECPNQVQQGETFEAVIRIRNEGDELGSRLSLHLDGSWELNLFDGVSVLQTDPSHLSTHEGSVAGSWFYHFGLVVVPGETKEVAFKLRAEEPGEFEGLVFADVTTGSGRLHTPGTPIQVTVLP